MKSADISVFKENGYGETGLMRISGTGTDDAFSVESGLAFDAPSVFVYRQSCQGSESMMPGGTNRLEIAGLGGEDQLTVGAGVFGDYEVGSLGGRVLFDGVDVIIFRGGRGDDTLDGAGADGRLIAFGGPGQDRLVGGREADRLRGGADDDILVGNEGADVLKGGSGNDTFLYGAIADASLDGPARERIEDFERGADVIDLSAIEVTPGGPVIVVDSADAAAEPIAGSFRFLGNFSPEIQILTSGDLYFDPEEQALKGFVGGHVSYGPNFAIELPGVENLTQDDLIL